MSEDIIIKDEVHYLEEFFKCNGNTSFVLPDDFSYEKLNKLASELNLFFVEPPEKENKIISPRNRKTHHNAYKRLAQRKTIYV